MVRIRSISILVGFAALLASCAPTAPSDPGTPNALLSSPDTLNITKATPTAASTLSLACGCEFDYSATNFGDTSKIRFTLQPSTGKLNSYTITASALPATPSGTYTSWVSLSAPDADVNNVVHIFYDTLHVTLKVP